MDDIVKQDDIMYAELSYDDTVVTLGGNSLSNDNIFISSDGVEGWYSSPATKASQTERQAGNGAHDVPENNLLYAARTVVVHVMVGHSSQTRGTRLKAWEKLQMAIGKDVTFRLVDDTSDTFVYGYIDLNDFDSERPNMATEGKMTVYCPRPERLSFNPHIGSMSSWRNKMSGGLQFDSLGDTDPIRYLHYPLTFGEGAVRDSNVCTVVNNGTYTSYPIITVSGYIEPDFTIVNNVTGGELQYKGDYYTSGDTIIFDSRSRTASINGVDVTRKLVSRDFPVVPPKSSVTLSVIANSTSYGVVNVICYDTFI